MKRDRSAYFKKYYKEHPEKYNKVPGNSTVWKRAHPERAREHVEAWRRAHPHERKAADKVYGSKRRAMKRERGAFTVKEWLALCAKYHNKCLCCGKKRPLAADHVVPLVCGGINTIKNIQPLCGPCNSKKHTNTIDFRNIRKS